MVTQWELKRYAKFKADSIAFQKRVRWYERRLLRAFKRREKVQPGRLGFAVTLYDSVAVSYGRVVATLKLKYPRMVKVIIQLVRRYSEPKRYGVVTLKVMR